MKIIVPQGMPNTDKTKTLNLVYSLLVPNGGGNSTNRQPLGGDRNDFSDIILKGNQRIAFFTMGDKQFLNTVVKVVMFLFVR